MAKNLITLPIPIGRPIGYSERAQQRMLFEVGAECDRMRNAVFYYWMAWAKAGGLDVVQKDGTIKQVPIPNKSRCNLYDHARQTAPRILSTIASGCSSHVTKWLPKKTAYNHPGERFRWKALVKHEIQLPNSRSMLIPLHNSQLKEGHVLHDDRGYVLNCSLYSLDSGRRHRELTTELDVSKLSPGHLRHLRLGIAGVLPICDSSLSPDEKGRGWRLLLVLNLKDVEVLLDPARILQVSLADPRSGRPFVATTPEGSTYRCGAGHSLVEQLRRLEIRNKVLAAKGRDNMRPGHGRGRVQRDLKPIARRRHGLLKYFRRNLAQDVVGLAKRHQCGTIEVCEPTLGERRKDWFAARGLTNDWTALLSKIQEECFKGGICYELGGRKKTKAKKKKSKPKRKRVVAK